MKFAIFLFAAVMGFAESNNYADPQTWLCRPGGKDACAIDLSSTVVRADGTLTVEKFAANPDAPVDCFYVYPTVSTDAGTNSDMNPDPAERNVIAQQFARFASQCRPYAPMYRQVTLAGLRQMMSGGGRASFESGIQYDDVRDAWRYYLEHDNRGRGFILVGHSQGSYVLAELIRQEIEGKPAEKQMVSAILAGATITVAKDKDTGGSFQHIPVCKSGNQSGCIITFTSFRSTVPPPANTLFGRPNGEKVAACTNPAALSGGSGELHAYLSTAGRTITGNSPQKPWVAPEKGSVTTSWVSAPGFLTAGCASNENANYLEITVHGDPADPRADDIVGDITPQWGLHLVDVNLAMGNLLEIVGLQAKAYTRPRQ